MSRVVPRLAALLLLLGGLLGACQRAPSSGPPPLKIAWIQKSLGNPVFELGRQGALQKAAELSASGGRAIEVVVSGPLVADPAEQVRVIEDVVSRGVDAIAISCIDPTACIEPINKAVASGIPVMTWDSDSPQSQRFTYLSIDNYEAGQLAARLLADAIGKQEGELAVLTGLPGALNLEERLRGFREGLAPYPGLRIIEIVYTNEDINLGVRGVEEIMQAHPDLDGWFFAGMWPLIAQRGAMPLWESASLSGSVKTVAFDTLPLELPLLRDGYLSALIGQKYWSWGYDSIQIVYDQLVNAKSPPAFINSGMDIVTINNVEAMIEAWATNDFSKPLPEP
jgi:ribose transport system substrate-binding protein